MVTNSALYQLQEDFEQWRSDLPAILQFKPEQPDPGAGILGLLSACIEFVFVSAFPQFPDDGHHSSPCAAASLSATEETDTYSDLVPPKRGCMA
jgi:hypothetical protein